MVLLDTNSELQTPKTHKPKLVKSTKQRDLVIINR